MGKILFNLTTQHLALLKDAAIGWDNEADPGAPKIDAYRPYGSSDLFADMTTILGIKYDPNEDEEKMPVEFFDNLKKLHEETQTALKIVLRTQSFEPGVYESDEYSSNWVKVADLS